MACPRSVIWQSVHRWNCFTPTPSQTHSTRCWRPAGGHGGGGGPIKLRHLRRFRCSTYWRTLSILLVEGGPSDGVLLVCTDPGGHAFCSGQPRSSAPLSSLVCPLKKHQEHVLVLQRTPVCWRKELPWGLQLLYPNKQLVWVELLRIFSRKTFRLKKEKHIPKKVNKKEDKPVNTEQSKERRGAQGYCRESSALRTLDKSRADQTMRNNK